MTHHTSKKTTQPSYLKSLKLPTVLTHVPHNTIYYIAGVVALVGAILLYNLLKPTSSRPTMMPSSTTAEMATDPNTTEYVPEPTPEPTVEFLPDEVLEVATTSLSPSIWHVLLVIIIFAFMFIIQVPLAVIPAFYLMWLLSGYRMVITEKDSKLKILTKRFFLSIAYLLGLMALTAFYYKVVEPHDISQFQIINKSFITGGDLQ